MHIIIWFLHCYLIIFEVKFSQYYTSIVFAKAREKARQSSCTNNLKQLSLAMLQYVQDYDETYLCWTVMRQTDSLGYQGYARPHEPYLKSKGIWYCPSDGGQTSLAVDQRMSYIVTAGIAGYTTGPITLARIQKPASVIAYCDDDETPYRYPWPGANCMDNYGYTEGSRHSGGDNILFADGHCKWYKSLKDACGYPAANWWLNLDIPSPYNISLRVDY